MKHEQVPTALTLDRNLTLQARAMYPIIRHLIWQRTRANGDTMTGELPPLPEVAALVGCSERALREYIAELRRAGWLTTTRAHRNRPQLYSLYSEPCPADSAGRRPAESAAPVRQNLPDSRARDREEVPDELLDPEGAEAPSGRPRNLVFDAIAEETAANVAVSAGEIAKAVKAIRAAEADTIRAHSEEFLAANPAYDAVPAGRIDAYLAAKIRQRAQRYRECRDWELTPTALAKHWNRIPTWQPDRKLTAEELANVDLSRYGL